MPREGHDQVQRYKRGRDRHFYPRAPGGARLAELDKEIARLMISIHVPREGHDYPDKVIEMENMDFYPRAPGGARHKGRACF